MSWDMYIFLYTVCEKIFQILLDNILQEEDFVSQALNVNIFHSLLLLLSVGSGLEEHKNTSPPQS